MNAWLKSVGFATVAGLILLCQTGCITYAYKYLPAKRVPAEFLAEPKTSLAPINLATLGQPIPPSYVVGPHDVLAVYVQGVLPPKIEEIPMVSPNLGVGAGYYQPNGNVLSPTVGVPIEVQASGNLPLPLIQGVPVSGLTMEQVAERIRRAYLEMGVLAGNRDRIYVTLIRPRVTRVLVIREDVGSEMPQQMRRDATVFTRRGRAQVVDLPAFENDVLHALTATGGLPGIDAFNEVWVLRGANPAANQMRFAQAKIEAGDTPDKVLDELKQEMTAVRVPLRHCATEPLPFRPEDVILNEGDIVFIAPRDNEFFYTGGLLPPGQIPLPRDHDVDVIEAVAMAQGAIAMTGGGTGSAVFRAGAGVGNIVPPGRVLIVRKLPNGQQIPIRVDLGTALMDPKERILIQPGDLLMVQYKPTELAQNVLLNIVNFNITGIVSQ